MKRFGLGLLLLFFIVSASGQGGTSFYHLGGATLQSTTYNASYFPNGTFFIGLPVISGVNVYFNNQFSYNDIIAVQDGIKSFDIDNLLSTLDINNGVSAHTNINLLQLGYRTPYGIGLSFFINEKIATDFIYSDEILNLLWKGNGGLIGKEINFSALGANINYFREIGLGMAFETTDKRLKLGARIKYLQGIVNMSTPDNLKAVASTYDEYYQLDVNWQNLKFQTAGLSQFKDESTNSEDVVNYLLSNDNIGFGLDLGLEYRIKPNQSISLAINDLGFIGWKENVQTYGLNDTSFIYNGVDLQGESIIDSLPTFSDVKLDTTYEQYTSLLPSNLIGSFTYTPFDGTDVIATLNTRIIKSHFNTAFGLGIRKKISPNLLASATITKLPQQFVNLGVSFAASTGPVQFYAGTDKIFGYSVPNMKWASFQFGINLAFGRGENGDSKGEQKRFFKKDGVQNQAKGVGTYSLHGTKIKSKRYESIYTIVPIQKKQERAGIFDGKNRFRRAAAMINSNSSRANKVGKKFKNVPNSPNPSNKKGKPSKPAKLKRKR
jgi:hypothetical protein|tara:strand:- start:32060 stop:33706 length:1647 start_codon:yes stop_codon:yes gene_type:complete